MPLPRKLVYSISGGSNNNNSNNYYKKLSYTNFFLFGTGYAIASLICTLPIFLLVVFQRLSAGGIAQGSIVFLTYFLGMGLIMIVVSIAIGVSNQTLIKWLKRIGSKMNAITSIVLIFAGSYLIYYNLVVGRLLQ